MPRREGSSLKYVSVAASFEKKISLKFSIVCVADVARVVLAHAAAADDPCSDRVHGFLLVRQQPPILSPDL